MEVRRSGHVRTPDPDSLQKEQGKQQVLEVQQPTLPEPPTLLQRLQAPLKKKGDAERHPKPDRVRANGLEYEICRASAYSVRPFLLPCLVLPEIQLLLECMWTYYQHLAMLNILLFECCACSNCLQDVMQPGVLQRT